MIRTAQLSQVKTEDGKKVSDADLKRCSAKIERKKKKGGRWCRNLFGIGLVVALSHDDLGWRTVPYMILVPGVLCGPWGLVWPLASLLSDCSKWQCFDLAHLGSIFKGRWRQTARPGDLT